MIYPMKPMVKSRTLDLINFDQVNITYTYNILVGTIAGNCHIYLT